MRAKLLNDSQKAAGLPPYSRNVEHFEDLQVAKGLTVEQLYSTLILNTVLMVLSVIGWLYSLHKAFDKRVFLRLKHAKTAFSEG